MCGCLDGDVHRMYETVVAPVRQADGTSAEKPLPEWARPIMALVIYGVLGVLFLGWLFGGCSGSHRDYYDPNDESDYNPSVPYIAQ